MRQMTIPQKQRQALIQLADQEGQSIDALIEQILREGIEKRQQAHHPKTKTERLQALAQIEEHHKEFLARHNNAPLDVDPSAFLHQIREERDRHLFAIFQENANDSH